MNSFLSRRLTLMDNLSPGRCWVSGKARRGFQLNALLVCRRRDELSLWPLRSHQSPASLISAVGPGHVEE